MPNERAAWKPRIERTGGYERGRRNCGATGDAANRCAPPGKARNGTVGPVIYCSVMAFITIIDYLGTFAFAIRGIRLASAKRFDWFGAYVVGFVTAVGGGTMRDLMLGCTPFWMSNVAYLIVSGLALLFVVGLRKYVVKLNNTFFIFDAIGLGLFTVVGVEKSIAAGYPMWVGIIMGTMTGAAGGMFRDIFINEVPLIFRKDIYAIACVCGGFIYYLCHYLGVAPALTQFVAACSVIVIRILAVRYGICLPALHAEDDSKR